MLRKFDIVETLLQLEQLNRPRIAHRQLRRWRHLEAVAKFTERVGHVRRTLWTWRSALSENVYM